MKPGIDCGYKYGSAFLRLSTFMSYNTVAYFTSVTEIKKTC